MRAPALVVVPLALLAVACGSSSSSSNSPATSSAPASTSSASSSSSNSTSVSTRSISGLGTVLVDGPGRTLYAFTPEKGGKVVCTGSCAALWPALSATSGQKPGASGGAHAAMISTVANPSGGNVVTYNGWPLHTYASDSGPGSASGQGISGKWYVISPSGTPITAKPKSGSGGSYGSGGSPY